MQSLRRSMLFVPGTRPELFAKALAGPADMVCVDLEDAVAPHLKAGARAAAVEFLGGRGGAERVLRINAIKTRAGLADLGAVADAAPDQGLLMLPKVDAAAEIRIADAVLSEAGASVGLIALIESAEGLENVQDIAAASPRLQLLLFGAADLSAELGVAMDPGPLAYARARIVHAAKRAGIGVLDVPVLDFRDLDRVRAETEAAHAMGFTGKALIHPSGVEIVNAAFTPTAEDVQKARAIMALFEASDTGLVVHEGKLIEAPVIRSMRRILDIAEALGAAS
ncbi:MAG: CoA ester lyase [Pseudomonadota bacterium]